MRACSVDGCGQVHRARGYCWTHWSRWRKHGSPDVVLRADQRGAANPGWAAIPTYKGAHLRVVRARGRAKEYTCAAPHCTHDASDWAYDHGDRYEVTDTSGRTYSTDPAHYQPMCRPCHRSFDAHS